MGFIAADGNVSKTTNIVAVEIHIKDVNHLRKLRKSLNSNHVFYFRKNRPMCRLQFSNKHIRKDLINLGVVPAKSLVLKFPTKIPDDLIRHFVRGYFDGDGHIASTGKKSCRFEVIGTGEFTGEIHNILTKEIKGIKPKLKLIKIGINTFRLRIDVSEYAFKALEYMYEDSNVYLDRKYQTYNIIKSKRT